MPLPDLTLQARFVFPVDGPPIEHGCVRVAGERITYVGPADRQADIDFGNAAIVPGFVNAHTHLELSNLRAKEVAAPQFTGWLRRVIEAQRGQSAATATHAVQRGIDASLAAGTTLLGDISTGGRSWRELQRSPLRAVVFCEFLGLKPQRALETATSARRFLDWVGRPGITKSPPAATNADMRIASEFVFADGTTIEPLPHSTVRASARRLSPSLSPHAPYSTHPILYELAACWGQDAAVPLCTHLAETQEELRLLEHGDGPLRDFLQSIGAWEPTWTPTGHDPASYLESLVTKEADWLIAHGNYLTLSEIQRLADRSRQRSTRRSIVYCPRTHAYFGHSRHPYREMLEYGLCVCLGTDGLASTSSLSILDEMRFLRRRDARLRAQAILYMATLGGATGLGLDRDCGSLRPGKLADIAVVRLPDRDAEDPHQLLLESDLPVVTTMIAGRIVFQLRAH